MQKERVLSYHKTGRGNFRVNVEYSHGSYWTDANNWLHRCYGNLNREKKVKGHWSSVN